MHTRSRFDTAVTAFTRQVIRRRRWVVAATIALTLLVGSGARGLFFNNNYRAFFSDENPQLTAFEALQDIYTKNDNILFVVAPHDGEVFTTETLAAVEDLTAEAWQTPYAIRVDAVTNFQHTHAEEDDLNVRDLVEDAASMPQAQLEAVRAIALAEPLLRDRLVDPDAAVTGVNVTLQLPGEHAGEVAAAVAHARELAERIRADHPGVEVYITGFAMLNNAFMEISRNEMMRLMPMMFAAMVLLMILTLRSAGGALATMLVVTCSAMVAMGAGGFFRIGLTPPTAQAPTIIMTLAIADSIHILVTMLRGMRGGLDKHDAIVESVRVNFMPVFLTSLSTVIGFLSLNFSDVPPFNQLGNLTAVGVTAAFVLSIVFLPALTALLPIRARANGERDHGLRFDRLADFVIRRRTPLLWASAAAAVGFAALVPLNTLDDRFVEYFDERIPFRTDTDYVSDHLSGIYQIEFSLGAGESGGISEPGYLQTLDAFASWYRGQRGVVHVHTFADVMKRLNKNLNHDDPAFYRLPDERDLAAQYLLLYEMSLPYGLDLNNQINVDKSATRVTVTLEDLSTTEIRAVTEAGQDWLRAHAPEATYSVGSGAAVMFAHISGINIASMLQGSAWALVMISFLMIFALRSLKLGLISFMPNLLPAVFGFGIWALLYGTVNLGLSIVVGMTMGIVVDDSIHFLSKYRRARLEQGLTAEEAVRYAFGAVGRALVVTSVILVVGFLILSTSAFEMNASMGLMTALTIGLALAIDFFALPPLLLWLDGRNDEKPARRPDPKPASLRDRAAVPSRWGDDASNADAKRARLRFPSLLSFDINPLRLL